MTTLDQRLRRLARACLYAIVDTGYVEPSRVPHVTEQLVLGGVDLIQLRAKKLPLDAQPIDAIVKTETVTTNSHRIVRTRVKNPVSGIAMTSAIR